MNTAYKDFSGPPQPPIAEEFPQLQKKFEESRHRRCIRRLQTMNILSWAYAFLAPLYLFFIEKGKKHGSLAMDMELLRTFLHGFAVSRWWKEQHLEKLLSINDTTELYKQWKKTVPVSIYEDLETYIQEPGGIRDPIDEYPIFGQSGWTSSGIPKRMRMVKQVPQANRYANMCVFHHISKQLPNHTILQGSFHPQVGTYHRTESTEGEAPEGCDVSAFMVKSQSTRVTWFYAYHPLILVADNQEKITYYAETFLEKNISSIMGATIRVEELLKTIKHLHGNSPSYKKAIDRLEVLLCGGMPIDPRLASFAQLGVPAEKIWGVYNSAEGMRSYEVRGLPYLQGRRYKRFAHTHLVEYTPATNITAEGRLHDAELVFLQSDFLANPLLLSTYEGTFFAVVTTYALPRYLMTDKLLLTLAQQDDGEQCIVEQILGRDNGMNERGEELMEGNIEQALGELTAKWYAIGEYALSPLVQESEGREPLRRHEWIIERAGELPTDQFVDLLDKQLQQLASDYQAKRTGNRIITHPPLVHLVPKWTLLEYLRDEKGKFGGQVKIKHIYNSQQAKDFSHLRDRLHNLKKILGTIW